AANSMRLSCRAHQPVLRCSLGGAISLRYSGARCCRLCIARAGNIGPLSKCSLRSGHTKIVRSLRQRDLSEGRGVPKSVLIPPGAGDTRGGTQKQCRVTFLGGIRVRIAVDQMEIFSPLMETPRLSVRGDKQVANMVSSQCP